MVFDIFKKNKIYQAKKKNKDILKNKILKRIKIFNYIK